MAGVLGALDVAVLVALGLALLRGLWNGLLREAFSIASLVAAAVATRLFAGPLGERLDPLLGGQLGPLGARVLAAVTIFAAVMVAGAVLARALRVGARAAGLGWLDRVGGGAIGLAEGAVIAIVALLVTGAVLGRDHPLVSGSRAFATAERVRELARRERGEDLPAVSAPPPSRPDRERPR